MKKEYVERINRVLDYIQDHLDEELSLERLAEVACFSPFHFHRVFRALTGEPIGQLVQRLRLERAAAQLSHSPHRSITEVALDAGFSSPATFARAFRERFGMSASAWRSAGESKNGKAMSNASNAEVGVRMHLSPGAEAPRWRLVMNEGKTTVDVEVKDLPEQTVAYLRHTGPYQGNAELFGRLFGQLAQWAGARGLLGPNARFLSLYHDDPSVTESDKLRVMCCCVVPPDTQVGGEIGKTVVAGGRYAVGRFELTQDGYGAAWEAMYGGWLPSSGFEPADGPAMEVYLNDPNQHPEKKHLVEICIPVRPLP